MCNLAYLCLLVSLTIGDANDDGVVLSLSSPEEQPGDVPPPPPHITRKKRPSADAETTSNLGPCTSDRIKFCSHDHIRSAVLDCLQANEMISTPCRTFLANRKHCLIEVEAIFKSKEECQNQEPDCLLPSDIPDECTEIKHYLMKRQSRARPEPLAPAKSKWGETCSVSPAKWSEHRRLFCCTSFAGHSRPAEWKCTSSSSKKYCYRQVLAVSLKGHISQEFPTLALAQEHCSTLPTCAGVTFNGVSYSARGGKEYATRKGSITWLREDCEENSGPVETKKLKKHDVDHPLHGFEAVGIVQYQWLKTVDYACFEEDKLHPSVPLHMDDGTACREKCQDDNNCAIVTYLPSGMCRLLEKHQAECSVVQDASTWEKASPCEVPLPTIFGQTQGDCTKHLQHGHVCHMGCEAGHQSSGDTLLKCSMGKLTEPKFTCEKTPTQARQKEVTSVPAHKAISVATRASRPKQSSSSSSSSTVTGGPGDIRKSSSSLNSSKKGSTASTESENSPPKPISSSSSSKTNSKVDSSSSSSSKTNTTTATKKLQTKTSSSSSSKLRGKAAAAAEQAKTADAGAAKAKGKAAAAAAAAAAGGKAGGKGKAAHPKAAAKKKKTTQCKATATK